ncbi:MAG: NAD-dependent DNA ligase LigA [Candidatus Vogelbacteria bacterium]|nr:NAD-dependent DNA ligase LigA [Candidatus Vogelbacteria bacterium]
MKNEVKEKIKKLREAINHYRYLYHVLDRQEISDEALDSLKYELTNLEARYPELVTPDSPTQRVAGRPLDKFEKVKHVVPQWSFNDAFTEEDIRAFDIRVKRFLTDELGRGTLRQTRNVQIPYTCELKIDGFKIVLTYENGLLKTAATRGDGVYGEDVTANIRTIEAVPLKLEKPVNIIAEGEIWMGRKDFDKLNSLQVKKGLPTFANPRNVAAGTIRQLDSKIVADRKLQAFIYDLPQASFNVPDSQFLELKKLQELGFKVNKNYRFCKNIDEVIDYWKEWGKKNEREDCWIDGVVLKVDSRKFQSILGYTGKAPRWAIAFKFRAKQATTKLLDIKIQVGRTGKLTPVAVLDSVLLAGSTVSRATLHNEDEIGRLDARIGDTVIIEKAGDVIPSVVSVVKDLRTGGERKFVFPNVCPVCGSKAVRLAGEADHKCANPNCFAKERRKLYYFASKHAFDIDGLGPKVIDLLADNDLVSTPADFFKLGKAEIKNLPMMGEKSAENLIKSLNDRRKISLARFIISMGIPQVGEETAYDVAKRFRTIEKIQKAAVEDLLSVNGIGEVIAESVYTWFREKQNEKVVNELLEQVKILLEENKVSGTLLSLAGKSFVFTGTMKNLEREEAKNMVRENGGESSDTVSSKTTYLVVGENPGSKYEKAKRLGVNILREEQFKELLG